MASGQDLRRLRDELGHSQVTAAQLLGISRATIQRWERLPNGELADRYLEELRAAAAANDGPWKVPYDLGRAYAVFGRIIGAGNLPPAVLAHIPSDALAGLGVLVRLAVTPANAARHHEMSGDLEGILRHVPVEAPRRLNTEDEGRFWLGYYHQRGEYHADAEADA